MGNPKHYGLELPVRCMRLIEELLPKARDVDDGRGGGGLSTTFLLSMAMPIINLPLERIQKQQGDGYADDRKISSEVADRISSKLRGDLKESPWFLEGSWSWVQVPAELKFNIAHGLPQHIAEELNDEAAVERSGTMQVVQFISILRNALAHGGIIYLNKSGFSTHGEQAEQFAFVSGQYDRENRDKLKCLNVLKVSEEKFLHFLRMWIDIISNSNVFVDHLYAPEI